MHPVEKPFRESCGWFWRYQFRASHSLSTKFRFTSTQHVFSIANVSLNIIIPQKSRYQHHEWCRDVAFVVFLAFFSSLSVITICYADISITKMTKMCPQDITFLKKRRRYNIPSLLLLTKTTNKYAQPTSSCNHNPLDPRILKWDSIFFGSLRPSLMVQFIFFF